MPRAKKYESKSVSSRKKILKAAEGMKEETKVAVENIEIVVQDIQKPLPFYEGSQVIAILAKNVQGKWHHCKMSDGTTKHVPLELF